MKQPALPLTLTLWLFTLLLPCLSTAQTLEQAIYRPVFETTKGTVGAGTAFVVTFNDKLYAISAQHLLGTSGGLDQDYYGKDMQALFKSVTLNPIEDRFKVLTSKTAMVIETAAPLSEETLIHDIFIANLSQSDAKPFSLAKSNPAIDEVIYVYAKTADGSQLLHKAKVAASSPEELAYFFDKKFTLRATSGAPVLNSNFEVIGINLAGGTHTNGKNVGWANPVNNIKNHLMTSKQKAVAKKTAQALEAANEAKSIRTFKRPTAKVVIQGFEMAPPQQVLYQPIFTVGGGKTQYGMAFVIEHKKQFFMVSSQQWLGMFGGLERDYYGDDMAKHFKGATFYPIYPGLKPIKNSAYVPIPEAQPAANGFGLAINDLFLSPLKSVDSIPFKLAKYQPENGEQVMVYSVTVDSKQLFHIATVVHLDGGKEELVYEFNDGTMLERVMGGAPVLNSKLEVVGMHVARSNIIEKGRFGMEKDTGRLIGIANPATAIKRYLPMKKAK